MAEGFNRRALRRRAPVARVAARGRERPKKGETRVDLRGGGVRDRESTHIIVFGNILRVVVMSTLLLRLGLLFLFLFLLFGFFVVLILLAPPRALLSMRHRVRACAHACTCISPCHAQPLSRQRGMGEPTEPHTSSSSLSSSSLSPSSSSSSSSPELSSPSSSPSSSSSSVLPFFFSVIH